jgi:hypothetical protein
MIDIERVGPSSAHLNVMTGENGAGASKAHAGVFDDPSDERKSLE